MPLAPAPTAASDGSPGPTLEVLTFNVWHGLRHGESKLRFPGEDAEDTERRFDLQVREIRRLDPDVLILQEVNPAQRRARRYAAALGYDEVHKVTSCGLHLGKLIKIPSNVNEGLAILAKPELDLRRIGTKRLSGDATCTATWGFQTRESRYGLFARITVDGQAVVLASTHLHSPAFMPPGFGAGLDRLVDEGHVQPEHRDEIRALLDAKSRRNVAEVEKLLSEIARHRERQAEGDLPPVILGGDFNTEPGEPGIEAAVAGGLTPAADPALITWDPIKNADNHAIGTKRSDPFDTRGIVELQNLIAPRRKLARKIDYIFVSEGVEVLSAELVFDEKVEGIYLSDHFGILAKLRLPQPAESGRPAGATGD